MSGVDFDFTITVNGPNPALIFVFSGSNVEQVIIDGMTATWDFGGSAIPLSLIDHLPVSGGTAGHMVWGLVGSGLAATVGVAKTLRLHSGIGTFSALGWWGNYIGALQTSNAAAFTSRLNAAGTSVAANAAAVPAITATANDRIFAAGTTTNTMSAQSGTAQMTNNSGTVGMNCQDTVGGSSVVMSWTSNAAWAVNGFTIVGASAAAPSRVVGGLLGD